MKIYSGVLVAVCMIVGAHAAPLVVDFSRSHTLEDLRKSNLALKEIAGGAGELDFSFQNQDVEVRLPGGRAIRQFVELGIIDSKDDLVTRFSITGGVMPQDQAFLVARNFHLSFGLPLRTLEDWNRRNQGHRLSGDDYGVSPVLRFYPIVSLGIGPSTNELYPWVIRLVIEWGWKEQRDWNEARVWKELPPPPVALISLDAPSGLKYERREAYKESIAETEALQKKLKEQSSPSPRQRLDPRNSASEVAPHHSSFQSESRWLLFSVIIAILAAAGAVLVRKFKRR